VRLRPVAIVVVLVMLLAAGLAGFSPAAASGPTRTKLRLVISNSETAWSTLEFADTVIPAFYVAATSPGTEVYRNDNTVGLRGGTGSATVDLILDVPAHLDRIQLNSAKDKAGTASHRVVRTNATSTTVADITNSRHDGDATVTTNVTRAALVGEGLQIPMVDPRRLALAFYYPWYERTTFDTGPWYDKPAGTAWRTESQSEVTGMVNQAISAGIDGFIIAWNGREDLHRRGDLVFNTANTKPGFQVSVLLELLHFRDHSGNFDMAGIKAAVLEAMRRTSNTSFLRVNGRPVMFVYGAFYFGAARWNEVRQYVAQNGYDPFYIGGVTQSAYGFDGLYIYNPGTADQGSLSSLYGDWAMVSRLQAQVDPRVKQRLWVPSVSPGFNDSYWHRLDPWNTTNVNRDAGARYNETWNAALSSRPEWVVVTSWNEWHESSHIQPSQRFGTQAMDQTRSWIANFKAPSAPSGGAPAEESGALPRISLPLLSGRASATAPSKSSAMQTAWLSLLTW
jgi:hypothetical protein